MIETESRELSPVDETMLTRRALDVLCCWTIMRTLELMKTHVVKTQVGATLNQAVDLMDLYQVSELPVVNEAGVLCGMISEADIFRFLLLSNFHKQIADSETAIADTESDGPKGGAKAELAANRPISDIMTSPAISVSEDMDASVAVRLLILHRLKRLPVLDSLGRVIGTLNRIDVLQAIFEGSFDVSVHET